MRHSNYLKSSLANLEEIIYWLKDKEEKSDKGTITFKNGEEWKWSIRQVTKRGICKISLYLRLIIFYDSKIWLTFIVKC